MSASNEPQLIHVLKFSQTKVIHSHTNHWSETPRCYLMQVEAIPRSSLLKMALASLSATYLQLQLLQAFPKTRQFP